MARRLGALLLAAPVAAAIACSSSTPAGELMVSLQTDMSLPKDVDTVRIEVYVDGKTFYNESFGVGPSGTKIPATLGIVAGSTPSEPVDVRVIALSKNVPVVVRESITTVPTDRLALLRMPIQWLCSGQVTPTGDGEATSSCPDGQSCVAGTCAAETVNSSALPDYDPTQVFGGAAGPDQSGGACLDTVGCFADGFGATVESTSTTCTIAAPSGGAGINVALVQGPTGAGICGPQACLLPLDNTSDGTGWTQSGDRLILPPAVCARLASKSIDSVAVTTACKTKTEAIPTCGPWNSSSSAVATVDAGAPQGSVTPPPASGNVTGTIDGLGMSIVDGIAGVGVESIPYSFAGSSGAPVTLGNRQVFYSVLSDTSGTCSFYGSSPVTGSQPAGSTFLSFIVVGTDATTQVGPGTYSVAPILAEADGGLPAQPTGAFSIITFNHDDNACNATPTGAGDPGLATSGSITIVGESLAGINGTFTATFGQSGSLQGSFSAPLCGLTADAGVAPVDAGTICLPGVGGGDAGGDSSVPPFSCQTITGIDLTACNPVTQSGCQTGQECAINAANQASVCVNETPEGGAQGQGKTCEQQSDCAAGTQCIGSVCETYCCTNSDCSSFGLACQAQAAGSGQYGACQ